MLRSTRHLPRQQQALTVFPLGIPSRGPTSTKTAEELFLILNFHILQRSSQIVKIIIIARNNTTTLHTVPKKPHENTIDRKNLADFLPIVSFTFPFLRPARLLGIFFTSNAWSPSQVISLYSKETQPLKWFKSVGFIQARFSQPIGELRKHQRNTKGSKHQCDRRGQSLQATSCSQLWSHSKSHQPLPAEASGRRSWVILGGQRGEVRTGDLVTW